MTHFQESEWTLEWNISNISYCWFKTAEPVESPKFTHLATLTDWTLLLYPRGNVDKEHVGIYLKRNIDAFSRKTNIIETSFRFAFLNKKGSCLNSSGSKHEFAKGSVSGIGKFLEQDKLFGTQREIFFPEDILIIQCTLCFKEEMPAITEIENGTLMTDFQTTRRKVLCTFHSFSSLLWQINSFKIRNESSEILVHFNLELNSRYEIYLKIISWAKCVKSFSFEIAVIDSEKRRVTFRSHKIFNQEKDDIEPISLKQFMVNESRFLPNDVLTLDCEYGISTGTIVHVSEHIKNESISSFASNEVIENVKRTVVSKQYEPHQISPLVEDLKCMYIDSIHCDIELRTSKKTFSAHKSILSARSSVFCRMFSNDMREKNSGHVDITDMDDETVHQMLLYIYTDSLVDLQFKSAQKLYSAADKYALTSLKESCSCSLKANISPNTVCEILILADLHQDEDLKSFVQNYISAHDKEVFCSGEWKDFMVNNLQLAAGVMYRKLSQN